MLGWISTHLCAASKAPCSDFEGADRIANPKLSVADHPVRFRQVGQPGISGVRLRKADMRLKRSLIEFKRLLVVVAAGEDIPDILEVGDHFFLVVSIRPNIEHFLRERQCFLVPLFCGVIVFIGDGEIAEPFLVVFLSGQPKNIRAVD